ILWGEIREAHARAKIELPGRLMPAAPAWKIGPKWYGKGMTANNVNALAGFHAENVLAIVDEAAGVPDFAVEAFLGCAVGSNDRIVGIGNPKCGPTHFFCKAAREKPRPGLNNTIRVKGTETPNYREGKDLIPGLQTVHGVEAIARKHRPGSPIYNAMVEAKFPQAGDKCILSYAHLSKARQRLADGAEPRDQDVPKIGTDAATFGDDLNVSCVLHGPLVWFPDHGIMPYCDEDEIARSVATIQYETKADAVALDTTGGYGSGPATMLIKQRERFRVPDHFRVIRVDFGSRALDPDTFSDRRSELWWHMREWFDTYGACDPDDELEEELLTPEWDYVGGRIKLEAKDKIKERIGRSPDRADALALAIAAQRTRFRRRTGTAESTKRSRKKQTRRSGYGEIETADPRRVLG
ncbi:MAG: hypothetical protein ACPGVG_18730, partial [Mycobacterium sp.]